jgi:hypothetical protein
MKKYFSRIPYVTLVLLSFMTAYRSEIAYAFDEGNTAAAVNIIESAKRECSDIKEIERFRKVDCIRVFLERSVGPLNAPDYADAKREILRGARELKQLVDRNVDNSKPVKRKGFSAIRAVKESAIAQVEREASIILEETAKRIVRAAGNSKVKQVHYQKIARVLDSTKVILRA